MVRSEQELFEGYSGRMAVQKQSTVEWWNLPGTEWKGEGSVRDERWEDESER